MHGDNIDNIIKFNDKDELTAQDKFEIMLHKYKKEYGYKDLTEIILRHGLASVKRNEQDGYYEIDTEDINSIYEKENIRLSFGDKLEILTQRVYQLYLGLGLID